MLQSIQLDKIKRHEWSSVATFTGVRQATNWQKVQQRRQVKENDQLVGILFSFPFFCFPYRCSLVLNEAPKSSMAVQELEEVEALQGRCSTQFPRVAMKGMMLSSRALRLDPSPS